jgi:hypothetical protein
MCVEGRNMKRRVKSGLILILLLCCSSLAMFLGVDAETSLGGEFGSLNNWSAVKGIWTLSNGVLSGSASTNDWALIHAGDASWTNYQVTVNMSLLNSNDEACLVVRYIDSVNFYWIGLGVLSHKYSIGRVVNDVYTELASSGLSSELQAGRSYAVTVVAVSGLLKMYVDGGKGL